MLTPNRLELLHLARSGNRPIKEVIQRQHEQTCAPA
jgi:hypothetical protein